MSFSLFITLPLPKYNPKSTPVHIAIRIKMNPMSHVRGTNNVRITNIITGRVKNIKILLAAINVLKREEISAPKRI